MPSTTPFINSLRDVSDNYDAFIIDIFGVIHDGIALFPETVQTLRYLKDAGKEICLLSNTPKRASGTAAQLDHMGVAPALYDHIVTAGEATHHALAAREDAFHQSCGNACWYIGTAYAIELLHGLDLNMVDTPQDASFILNSMPGTETRDVEILEQRLKIALDKDLPMICSNPDLVVNIGDEQYECAGTFAAMYEEMGGRVVYHGKPHAPVYERCHALLGHGDKSKILAIGDAFHTDIAGANGFGIDSLLNLTGIHWDEVTVAGQPDPDKLQALIQLKPQKPTYAIGGFR